MGLEINNVVLSGNLTRDVELREVSSGRKVCTLSVANNRTYVSNGEKTVETSFVDVDVWGVVAENCNKYLKKGSPVVVLGRIKQERWENENGEKRNRIKVVASNVQFISFGNRSENESTPAPAENAASNAEAWT